MRAWLVEYEDDRNEHHVGYAGGHSEAFVRRALAHLNVIRVTELPPNTWEENIDERPELELNY